MPEGGDTAEATSSDVAAPTEGDGETARPKHLLLDELSDRLDTLRLIRTDDEQRADAILEQFGAKGKV
ncbi:MAG: hypothetical protein QOH10_2178, partial [Actinomycetota bacterium]|nr:hypothetical protein [Actinomycetota bacterium]